MKTAEV